MINVMFRVSLIVAITASLTVCGGEQSGASEPAETRRAARLMPPATLKCSRNDLTSYTGLVIQYTRTPDSTSIVIRTDADTTEKIVVRHDNPANAFLLEGAPFAVEDWQKIESEAGVLHLNMRVTAWVCLDGKTQPVLDWRPGRDFSN